MVDAQLKADAQKWMTEWLSGPDYDGKIERERRARFPDVQRASFYRWWRQAKVQAAKAGALEAQQAARILVAEEERQQRLSEVATKQAKLKSDARRISAHLPKPISPDSILPVPKTSTVQLIGLCMNNAMRIMAGCEDAEGNIQDPKMLLQASNHLLACIATQAKVTELLFDAQRIDQLQTAMMDEISQIEPEVSRRILDRFSKLLREWGH
jgi:hypothetical protein